jgi:hypothetical protein
MIPNATQLAIAADDSFCAATEHAADAMIQPWDIYNVRVTRRLGNEDSAVSSAKKRNNMYNQISPTSPSGFPQGFIFLLILVSSSDSP